MLGIVLELGSEIGKVIKVGIAFVKELGLEWREVLGLWLELGKLIGSGVE